MFPARCQAQIWLNTSLEEEMLNSSQPAHWNDSIVSQQYFHHSSMGLCFYFPLLLLSCHLMVPVMKMSFQHYL